VPFRAKRAPCIPAGFAKRGISFFLTLLALVVFFSVVTRPAARQSAPPQAAKSIVPDNPNPHPAPEQPIPYSHKKHLAMNLECKMCHTNPEPGKLMTFPDTGKCMQCHVAVAKDKPSIKKLAEYVKSKQTVPWVRVYTVLPGVTWTHRAHLNAGVKCETCHGQVQEMDAMAEVTSVTTMYACLNCHEMNHAKSACDTCHKH
jgi:hypothetical protein